MSPAEAEARFQQGWAESFQKREARRKRFQNMRRNIMRLRRGESLKQEDVSLEFDGSSVVSITESLHSTAENPKYNVRVLHVPQIRQALLAIA